MHNHPNIKQQKDMDLTNKILTLRDKLPHGSYNRIAEETGFSYQYVVKIMNGIRRNNKVVLKALEIYREHAAEMEVINSSLESI